MMTNCGFIAVVGRPNVGKSTLLNKLIGEKISITADKPQTTRHKILGVKTIEQSQAIFIDTPGIHKIKGKAINQAMNRAAFSALYDVDLIIFVIESLKWTDEDQLVLNKIKSLETIAPVILVINKVDKVLDKEKLLPFIAEISKYFDFADVVPISALKYTSNKLEALEKSIFDRLPENPHFFEKNQITDRNLSFRLAEIIREKLTRMLGQELPYALTVQIEALKKEEKRYVIHGIIWVEKNSQKQIIIGKQGSQLKQIGIQARLDMEKLLNFKVNLKLWVKVKSGWSDSNKSLMDLGIIDAD